MLTFGADRVYLELAGTTPAPAQQPVDEAPAAAEGVVQQQQADPEAMRQSAGERFGNQLLGGAGAAAIAAAVASGGWVQSLKPLMPDFSRLNPLSGLANMFTKKKLLDTLKMLLMTSILL